MGCSPVGRKRAELKFVAIVPIGLAEQPHASPCNFTDVTSITAPSRAMYVRSIPMS